MKGSGFFCRIAVFAAGWGICCCGAALCAAPADDALLLEAGWSSRYVREGVDRFSDASAFVAHLEMTWQRLALVVVPVVAEGGAGHEITLGGEYRLDLGTFALAEMQLVGGLRRVEESVRADVESWEMYGSVAWAIRGGFVWDVDLYYAVYPTTAGYLELGLRRPIGFGAIPGRFVVSPGLALGYDFGIISGRKVLRTNHLHAMLRGDWWVVPRFGLSGSLHHTIPADRFESLYGGQEQSWIQVGVRTWF